MDLVNDLKDLIGKKLILYRNNNFRYEGKLLDVSNDGFIKIYDFKKLQIRYLKISELLEWEVIE